MRLALRFLGKRTYLAAACNKKVTLKNLYDAEFFFQGGLGPMSRRLNQLLRSDLSHTFESSFPVGFTDIYLPTDSNSGTMWSAFVNLTSHPFNVVSVKSEVLCCAQHPGNGIVLMEALLILLPT